MPRIMIDPGHGGSETGAVNKTTTEKAINLEVASLLKQLLETKGFVVGMTRFSDTAVSLAERCNVSNLWKSDLFVSIHHNAADGLAKGYEIYHCTGSDAGTRLAELISAEFIKKQSKRFCGSGLYAGSKPGNYYVLENTNCPAALTEYLFMDSEFGKYNAEVEAKAIFNAICKYFGVETQAQKTAELSVDDILKTLVDNKIINSADHWKAVFDGSIKPVPEYVKIAFCNFAKALKH